MQRIAARNRPAVLPVSPSVYHRTMHPWEKMVQYHDHPLSTLAVPRMMRSLRKRRGRACSQPYPTFHCRRSGPAVEAVKASFTTPLQPVSLPEIVRTGTTALVLAALAARTVEASLAGRTASVTLVLPTLVATPPPVSVVAVIEQACRHHYEGRHPLCRFLPLPLLLLQFLPFRHRANMLGEVPLRRASTMG